MSTKTTLLVLTIGTLTKKVYFFFESDNMAFESGTSNAITLTLSRKPTQQEINAAVA